MVSPKMGRRFLERIRILLYYYDIAIFSLDIIFAS